VERYRNYYYYYCYYEVRGRSSEEMSGEGMVEERGPTSSRADRRCAGAGVEASERSS
jgi:hypothetical protein